MDCGLLASTGEQNVRLVPVEPGVKSSKTREKSNSHARDSTQIGGTADPPCYSSPVGAGEAARHGLFENMEMKMTRQAHACADCKSYIAITRSWPGGWQKADSPDRAVRDLKDEWGSIAAHAVYRVHPETTMDEMANFHHPRGHGPVRIQKRRGVWVEVQQ